MAGQRFNRRRLLVAAGAAGLVGAAGITLPAGAVEVDAEQLRARLLGPVRPHVGYAESTGRLGLPEIPQLESASRLLTTTTRIRAFVAGPDRRRYDQLDPAGERDTYLIDGTEYVWDFGAQQLTRVLGSTPMRLPRAGDLAPPELVGRLLRYAPDEPVQPLPARRLAGRTAAGLRLVVTDPATTIGQVDIWADADGPDALPLRVEISARTGPPVLVSGYLEVQDRMPEPDEITPTVPPGAGSIAVDAADISGALRVLDADPPPDRLAGRDRVRLTGGSYTAPVGQDQVQLTLDPDAGLPGVGLYGTGLARFALIPVGTDIARQAVDGAGLAGGELVEVQRGRAVALGTPLLSLVAHARRRIGVLLVGTVSTDVLRTALSELPAGGGG